MNLRWIETFVTVAECLNFTKAAEKLYMTQSSTSKIIKSLEDELETQLFYRSPKIELTDVGEAIYKQCIQIINLTNNISLEVENFYELNKGEIKIGIPPLTGSHFFPRIIGEFNSIYPNVELKLFEGGSRQIESKLDEGSLDVGVMMTNPAKGDIFEFFEFVKSPLLLVVNKDNELSRKEFIRFEELKNEKLILFQEDFKLNDNISERCLQSGFEPTIICKSSQKEFIAKMVETDVCVGFLPQVTCMELNNDDLSYIPLEEPTIYLNLAIAWKKDRYLSHASRKWIEFAAEKLGVKINKI
ncbi:MAG: LysR family transcriptional regulator [Tissierellia bacterium]|nr:LysR family transcriptional regulator [Tissierellia bacterium]